MGKGCFQGASLLKLQMCEDMVDYSFPISIWLLSFCEGTLLLFDIFVKVEMT